MIMGGRVPIPENICTTVDGSEIRRSPVDMVDIPLFMMVYQPSTFWGKPRAEFRIFFPDDFPIFQRIFEAILSLSKNFRYLKWSVYWIAGYFGGGFSLT